MIIFLLVVLAATCVWLGLANSIGLKFAPSTPALLSLIAGFIPALFLTLALTGGILYSYVTMVRSLFYATLALNFTTEVYILCRHPRYRRRSTTLLFSISAFICSWRFSAILYFLIAMAHR